MTGSAIGKPPLYVGLMGNCGNGSMAPSLFEPGALVKTVQAVFNEINNYVDIKKRIQLIQQPILWL
jgi:hypothetical protein